MNGLDIPSIPGVITDEVVTYDTTLPCNVEKQEVNTKEEETPLDQVIDIKKKGLDLSVFKKYISDSNFRSLIYMNKKVYLKYNENKAFIEELDLDEFIHNNIEVFNNKELLQDNYYLNVYDNTLYLERYNFTKIVNVDYDFEVEDILKDNNIILSGKTVIDKLNILYHLLNLLPDNKSICFISRYASQYKQFNSNKNITYCEDFVDLAILRDRFYDYYVIDLLNIEDFKRDLDYYISSKIIVSYPLKRDIFSDKDLDFKEITYNISDKIRLSLKDKQTTKVEPKSSAKDTVEVLDFI